ncbi:Molybdopterin molybdenumtransferase [hydrothermal vent metagenome]|uniref:molybdopterin molybdotransferase n=1 Tax=hydrothermal vent metagenome TaxID=652676 RepID=A0A3B1DVK6_9ZZZZ
MISVEEAQKIILNEIQEMPPEKVLLSDSLGRTLAEEIYSPLDHPPWDTSAMDGYAIHFSDTATASPENPSHLRVVETIPAGALPKKRVKPGEAAKIMTGAPMPSGANAVVKVEDTSGGHQEVQIFRPSEDGEYIRHKGEAIRKNDPVLKKGMLIRSAEIAMMASIGKSVVPVFQGPRIAILSTGDELADLDEPLGRDKILNSNGYGLAAQVSEAGGLPINLGIAKDDKTHLEEKISSGLSADFLIISGGVSMGDYDFVIEVLEKLGVTMHLWKVAMKPGKPVAFGTKDGRPVFGLPGNPVSSMVTFEQFVRPAILKTSGRTQISRPLITATLQEDIHKRPGRRQFLRAILSLENGIYQVRSTGAQGSAVLMSLVKANALMILPEEGDLIKAGTKISVQMLS